MSLIQQTEENTLCEFRKLVKDLDQSDATLCRFLRARNNDFVKAEDMLRKAVAWHENRKRELEKCNIPECILNGFPHEYPGVDYKNRAVMYVPVGAWPARVMLEAGYKEEMYHFIFACWERMISEIEKTGEQCTLVVDFDELTYWKAAHYESTQMIMKVFRDFEANYPERLGEVLVINAPFVFNIGWRFCKPILTGNTLSKFHFLGSDETVYIPAMLKRMPVTSLPRKLREIIKTKKMIVEGEVLQSLPTAVLKA